MIVIDCQICQLRLDTPQAIQLHNRFGEQYHQAYLVGGDARFLRALLQELHPRASRNKMESHDQAA